MFVCVCLFTVSELRFFNPCRGLEIFGFMNVEVMVAVGWFLIMGSA